MPAPFRFQCTRFHSLHARQKRCRQPSSRLIDAPTRVAWRGFDGDFDELLAARLDALSATFYSCLRPSPLFFGGHAAFIFMRFEQAKPSPFHEVATPAEVGAAPTALFTTIVGLTMPSVEAVQHACRARFNTNR